MAGAHVALVGLVALLVAQGTMAQGPPTDLGPVGQVVNDLAGQVVPPVVNTTYDAMGQNVTREDVRVDVEMNFTKGDVDVAGLLIGSGRAEVMAKVHTRIEMRVISSDRIRAAAEGENAYNVSAENATFLSQVYLPADAFRASLTAEVAAFFQEEQEAAVANWLRGTVPELDVLAVDFRWSNVHPYQVFGDDDAKEPPIVLEVDVVLQYVRIESLRSLMDAYLAEAPKSPPDAGPPEHEDEAARLKREAGDPLRTRDFFAAAAYTQLLNLSMQPGWSLDITLRLPRGYSFTYFNEAVRLKDDQTASFSADALESDEEEAVVVLAAITHKRGIALVLFAAVWIVGLAASMPLRWLYKKHRLARVRLADEAGAG